MDNLNARKVEVIMVEDGDELIFFTLQGVEIGRFKGGARQDPKVIEKKRDINSAVVTAPLPRAIKKQKEREAEKNMTLEERIKYEQENA